MKEGLINKTIEYLDQHRHGALATIREDGTPQASTVSYVSKGLDIYFMTDPGSQKAKNMAFNPNVAFAISDDFLDWDRIVAVQLAGKAAWVEDKDELSKTQALFAEKFPQIISGETSLRTGLGS